MFDDFQEIDEDDNFGSYEPVEPDGLKQPRYSDICYGHDDVEEKLINLINSGAMPHALIFSGIEGIGKSTLAFKLARYLLKHGTADSAQDSLFGDAPLEATSLTIPADDPVFAKVASGGHPDFLYIERPTDAKTSAQKKNIDVTTARKVAPFLRKTASDGGWRVVLVDDADTMNRNAQNALLKILEEPPANALLILITHRLGAMIPTIRSRCRVLNFQPLELEILEKLMTQEVSGDVSTNERKMLSALASGSMGAVQKIIESSGFEIMQQTLAILEGWEKWDWEAIHHLSDSVGRAGQEDNFYNIERIMFWLCETCVFTKAKNQLTLPAPIDMEAFTNLLNHYSLDEWVKICDNLREHFAQAHFSNLDKKQAVLAAFNIIKTV